MDKRRDRVVLVVFGGLIVLTVCGVMAFLLLGIFAGPRIGTIVTPAMPPSSGSGPTTTATAVPQPALQDAQSYADEMGISLEEALERLDEELLEAISTLQIQLQENEAETFAGLWLQHEPEYRVVVAFTRDGEQTIGKYLTNDSELASLVEVRSARYTYQQLQADQQTIMTILDELNMSAAVGILVQENHVELSVTDRAAFDAALADADATLPESAVVVAVYEPVGANPPFDINPVPGIFMPQLKRRDATFMAALLIGELVVEDGCLRVRDVYTDESRLVIWQADYYLTDNDGNLEVLDETGAIVARVGARVYMGGGETSGIDDAQLQEPIPSGCGGPYWRMGEFLPEEYIANVAADLPPEEQADEWQLHTLEDVNLKFAYPAGWYVHGAGKALQITPNTEPVWSSYYDPEQPNDGPYFDLLYNLNRQMGDTPLAEIEFLLQGYAETVEAIEPAAPLVDRPDAAMGAYRFTFENEDMVLLLGAVVNSAADSPHTTIALTAVVEQDELESMQSIFAEILRSLGPADGP